MSLSTSIGNTLDTIYSADYATAITYAGESVYAVVFDEELDETIARASNKRQCIIDVRSADVSQPAYRDAVVISGVTWETRQWQLLACGAQWRIWLERDTRQLMRSA